MRTKQLLKYVSELQQNIERGLLERETGFSGASVVVYSNCNFVSASF